MNQDAEGSKWSIEEVGDTRHYNPEADNNDDKEQKHYLVLFVDIEKLKKLVQNYRLYLISAQTEEEFAKVLHKLMQQEKRLHNGIQISFLNVSDHDSDLYKIIIKCDNCAHCKFSITVDETKCSCKLDSKDFVPIEKLLDSECKNCGSSPPDMWLNSKSSFNSCFEFHLICNNNTSLRTPTNAKICVTTLNGKGEIIWKEEKSFAACFHNMDETSTSDMQIIEQNHENILAKMTAEKQVIQSLINQKVLSSDFQVDNLARIDLIGSLLRHLFLAGNVNVLPHFVDALRATQLQQNLELADILCRSN